MKCFAEISLMSVASRRLIALLAVASAATLCGANGPRPVVDDSKAITQTAAKPELPTLYVVGDSTARSDAPLRGWGSEIGAFFDPAKINVVNRAIGGRSTRTFITDGRWDKVHAELKPGDFVLVQFGHNDNGDYKDPKAKGRPSIRSEGEETDEAIKGDLKTMETIHSFGWYMRKFATDAKAKGAAAKLLGFAEHDIQILMSVGKLTPLGDPAPNVPKWFAAVEMIRLAADQDWLHKATKEIAKYWRQKRERRQTTVGL
jgi:lysophospholipase L1-like esterase